MNIKLKVEGIQSGYGEIQVLRGIEMLCGEAQITALVGSNGAGKSTLLRTLAGILPTATGRILHGEAEIQRLPSHERVARGIIMVPEGRLVFPDLSVEENLRTGAVNVRAKDVWSRTIEEIYDLFPRLLERQKQLAGTLSGGEQQMLSIARALARDIKLLLLDEPYEGLAPVIVDEIEKTLQVIKSQGITTIIVEQNAVRALNLADRSVILDTGSVVFDGSAKEVLDNKELREEYLAI